jgi:hypothetical protein
MFGVFFICLDFSIWYNQSHHKKGEKSMEVRTNMHSGQLDPGQLFTLLRIAKGIDPQQLNDLQLVLNQLTPQQITDLMNVVCKIDPNEIPALLKMATGGS